ncbi:hypothetical protein PPYR_05285 [Photinus pyralis]|uniref:Protoporphyrinogen oxidase n=1 Tax=Photinus pyralis TaxID=7054 RepID=A0A1Y1N1Y6_PHOPY|nr:protoporphyrinogen oxidase-like [Photinus pyralis]XP_031358042.1 protoporphyrinogen oxidase-like [Photinus pyralis]KAB0790620.1 hypothetical protein PPYR_14978 [Photinus pyralis]KAB0800931.1 hypothetical protein PPYR_05285 [Photinus pyralis]
MNKVILGGGLSGLSAAYYLRRKFPLQEITLLEGSSRTSGWIKSTKYDDFIFEQGPRTIRPQGVKGINTLKLIEELGLEDDIKFIPRNHPAALNRMIYVNGQLHTLPSSLLRILTKQPPFSKSLLNYLVREVGQPRKFIRSNDESIYDFVYRRFGKEIADYAISPLICGICAGNAKEISVKFLMENLFTHEQKYGSISKGLLYDFFNKSKEKPLLNSLSQRATREKWSVYFFKDGIETLPRRLRKFGEENNVNFMLNKLCTKIEIGNEVSLHTNTGEIIRADYLISSISPKTLGQLIVGHRDLNDLLVSIPCVSVCVVNLHFKNELLEQNGFGFLVPPKENIPILGVIFDSCCTNTKGSTNLTVMMGGYWFEKYFGKNPTRELLLDTALQQLNTILGIKQQPDLYQVSILQDCIPQYVVGHNDTVRKIHDYLQSKKLSLSLCGNSFSGVGINDCIYSAKTTIDNL